MFTLLNAVFVALGLVTFVFAVFTDRLKLSRVYREVLALPEDARGFRGSFIIGMLIYVYLLALALPLKEIHREGALVWSVVMLMAMCESIFTYHTLVSAVAQGEPDQRFPIHDSLWFRLWGGMVSLVIVVGCAVLIAGSR
jgi:membrane-bound metal-dependent hydrolase YbcI (DUF457 family)